MIKTMDGGFEMVKFTDEEIKKIAKGVKKTTEKYGLPTKKKETKKK